MSRWIVGALVGAAFGAVVFQTEGRNGYARRIQRLARRRGTFFFHPAAQWALLGGIIGAASNVAQGQPALSGVRRGP
jgi:hypothetical protein